MCKGSPSYFAAVSSHAFIRSVLEKTLAGPKKEGDSANQVALKLELSGSDLSVALFADVMNDAQWIQLSVTTYELALSISADAEKTQTLEVSRELVLRVGAMSLSRMIEDSSNPARNWVRSSRRYARWGGERRRSLTLVRSDSILEFPASSLVMRTRQPVSGPRRHEQVRGGREAPVLVVADTAGMQGVLVCD